MTAPTALAQTETLRPGGYTFTARYQIADHDLVEEFTGVAHVIPGQSGDDVRDLLAERFAALMGVRQGDAIPLSLTLRRAGEGQ